MSGIHSVKNLRDPDNHSPIAGLPDHWEATKFGYHFTESDERNGEKPPGPLLSISEYRGVELNTRTDGQKASLDVSNYRVVRPHQLAANMMWLNHGGIGVSSLTGHISPDYKVFHISKSFNPRYVHHLFRSSRYVGYFASIATGVRPNAQRVTKTVLDATPVPLPSLDEQVRIADYLDRETGEIDAMVGKLGELSEKLEARRSAVIRTELADPDFRYPRVPLQCIAQIGSGDAISADEISDEGDVAVYGGNGLRGFTSSFNQNEDRVLIGRQGALCGNVHLAKAPFWASEHALVLHTYVSDLDLRWLAYATRDLELGRLSTAAAQPGITATGVGREVLPYPPPIGQKHIADHLDAVTARIDAMLTKVAELKALLIERRAALITDVVTGKKEVA
ncbi:restriction endonuclease subunit S [Streptomyces sp. NPDC058611]|uniref:restriction endonuclease subunit S n=1 Tax=unclassified Streptomyces TaxID=2593676 RepID=UPI00365A9570